MKRACLVWNFEISSFLCLVVSILVKKWWSQGQWSRGHTNFRTWLRSCWQLCSKQSYPCHAQRLLEIPFSVTMPQDGYSAQYSSKADTLRNNTILAKAVVQLRSKICKRTYFKVHSTARLVSSKMHYVYKVSAMHIGMLAHFCWAYNNYIYYVEISKVGFPFILVWSCSIHNPTD